MIVSDTNRDERLLAALLTAVERPDIHDLTGMHIDDESMALFAAGMLRGDEKKSLVEHLDQCAVCRHAVSALLMLPDDAGSDLSGPPMAEAGDLGRSLHEERDDRVTLSHGEGSDLGRSLHEERGDRVTLSHGEGSDLGRSLHEEVAPSRAWRNRVGVTWFALAASLLLAVGLLWGTKSADSGGAENETYRQVAALVVNGEFDEAELAVAKAEEKGLVSDRLKSLRAEATRRIPDPIALAYAGRLSDFGYKPGGIAARGNENAELGKGAKPALEQLEQAGSSEVEVLLNRGHALLTLGQWEQALAEFDHAVKLAPTSALAWLGRGLANYMLDGFEAAAADFRKSLEIDPSCIAAKMNLAMAVDELGDRDDALATWRSLLEQPLSETDKKLVERAIEELTDE